MATTTTTPKEEPVSTTTEPEAPKVDPKVVESIRKDPRFSVKPPPIQTAEDAYNAFLREEITEAELRAAVSMFGGNPAFVHSSLLERPDNAYVRTVPDDLVIKPQVVTTTVEERMATVHAAQEQRELATSEAELSSSTS